MRFGITARWAAGSAVALALLLGFAAASRWPTPARAQDRPARPNAGRPRANPAPAPVSAQDALIRPFDFPFRNPVGLTEASATLAQKLGFAVALDRAALDRQDVRDDDEVQLDLAGVRLKVGLKLLLDPLHLTFRVIPEDNLLIITDAEGSEDPVQVALGEIKAMHKELHDLQDAVDDLRDLVEEELGFEDEPEDPFRSSVVAARPGDLRTSRHRAATNRRRPSARRDRARP